MLSIAAVYGGDDYWNKYISYIIIIVIIIIIIIAITFIRDRIIMIDLTQCITMFIPQTRWCISKCSDQ